MAIRVVTLESCICIGKTRVANIKRDSVIYNPGPDQTFSHQNSNAEGEESARKTIEAWFLEGVHFETMTETKTDLYIAVVAGEIQVGKIAITEGSYFKDLVVFFFNQDLLSRFYIGDECPFKLLPYGRVNKDTPTEEIARFAKSLSEEAFEKLKAEYMAEATMTTERV